MKRDNTQLLQILRVESEIIWTRYTRLFPAMKNYEPPVVLLNNRLTSTAGRCFVEHNKIEMATKLFPRNMQELLEVTLPHEFAHQVDFNLHGLPANNRWHGKTWSDIMVRYGLPPEPYHSMSV